MEIPKPRSRLERLWELEQDPRLPSLTPDTFFVLQPGDEYSRLHLELLAATQRLRPGQPVWFLHDGELQRGAFLRLAKARKRSCGLEYALACRFDQKRPPFPMALVQNKHFPELRLWADFLEAI